MIQTYLNQIVKHVPYIWDGHGIKAFVSLSNLQKRFPDWDKAIWEDAVKFIKSDEPQVTRLYHKDFEDLEEIVDPTSGRDFGPSTLVRRGIFPLSYWGVWRLYKDLGYEELVKSFLDDAVQKVGRLGHEVSILIAYLEFYPYIKDNKELELYTIERFTEFVSMSFAGREDTFSNIKTKEDYSHLLKKCLTHPEFFGHNILAFVWAEKGASYFNQEQQSLLSEKMDLLFGKSDELISTAECLDDKGFESALIDLIQNGPKNVHRYTLAYALSYLWDKYSQDDEYKLLLSHNVIRFREGSSVN